MSIVTPPKGYIRVKTGCKGLSIKNVRTESQK